MLPASGRSPAPECITANTSSVPGAGLTYRTAEYTAPVMDTSPASPLTAECSDARALEERGGFLGDLLSRPRRDASIERRGARAARVVRNAGDACECPPLLVGEHRDRDPTVVPRARIHAVRRAGRLLRRIAGR